VLNKNKPQIRKLKSDSERYSSLMSGVFVIDNNDDEAYDKYISFREQADEADRLCAILEAEVRKARALVEKRNQAIASADQAIANAKTHRDCIKATLEEAILEMANVPIEYHHLVRIIDGRHGHKSVCIAREDIPGACLLLGVSDGRLTNVSAFAEQINLLRCRDEQNEMLAAD